MLTRLRWLTVILPVVLVGVIEVLGDDYLDSVLPSPVDVLLIPLVVLALAWPFSSYAFGEIDRLASTIRDRNTELEARNASAAALHRVNMAIAAVVELDAILQAVVDSAARLLHADVAVLVLPRDDASLELRAACGPGVAVDPSGGLPGTDFRRFVRPEYLRGQLAAPLQRGGRTVGTLAVGDREGLSFGVDALEVLSSLASQAAVAIENDRLQREVGELAARAERERIARDMHDGIAQVLGYVNTKSQAVGELLAVDRVDDARLQLDELAAASRSVYVDVREAILGLSSPAGEEDGLVASIEAYAARFLEASKIAVSVETGPGARDCADALPAPVRSQLQRVVREALTNVRKHAAARRVVVALSVDDHVLHVRVDDDGRGFEPDVIAPGDWPHLGLRTMHDRMASVGGTVEIRSRPGEGTRVDLSVPAS